MMKSSAGKKYTYEPSRDPPSEPCIFSGKDRVFTIHGEAFPDDFAQYLEDAAQAPR